MPRRSRDGSANVIFHVLNRAVRGTRLFETPEDYLAFERILSEAVTRAGLRLLAYCVMPNHWHLVVWPNDDQQLSKSMHWLTLTHAARWGTAKHVRGTGAVYQDRFKAIPVQSDRHFLTLCRYVERNALRAGLVDRAESWQPSSLWQRCSSFYAIPLHEWPILRPADWVSLVNEPQTVAETEAIRKAVQKGRPLGNEDWQREIAGRLGLNSTLHPRGRPRRNRSGNESGSLF